MGTIILPVGVSLPKSGVPGPMGWSRPGIFYSVFYSHYIAADHLYYLFSCVICSLKFLSSLTSIRTEFALCIPIPLLGNVSSPSHVHYALLQHVSWNEHYFFSLEAAVIPGTATPLDHITTVFYYPKNNMNK